jgi:hypothetical protein
MKTLAALTTVSAGALLSNPTFPASAWNNWTRKAYIEPILVRDGFHDFVLMGAPDYAEMQKLAAWAVAEQAKRKVEPIGSPDIGIVATALAQMAKVGVPKRPIYQMKCPACNGAAPANCTRCHGKGTVDTDCQCNAAGKIVCQPSTRC